MPKLVLTQQDKSTSGGAVRTYRQLKGVRGQMRRCLKELRAQSKLGRMAAVEKLEEATRDLAERKTFLRKKFEKLTQRKGPYRAK